MSSTPTININSTTGSLSGTPDINGQWVVGVCVQEFRGSQLIGTHHRDFQFNVVTCNVTVLSAMQDQMQPCSGYTVNFLNQSIGGSQFHWDFGVNSLTNDTSNLVNPTYVYPDTGNYVVTLIAEPGKPCNDTLKKTFYVYPVLSPTFTAPPDQCITGNSFNYSVTGTYAPYSTKERKLRLLNGTHTFNCGTAFLCGFNITREAVLHPVYGAFTKELMHHEIAPAIPFTIDEKVKTDFANSTFERFCNPFIDHQWQSITVQYTSKMKMRNMPLLQRHYELNSTVPMHMATGFAAYLLYMKVTKKTGTKYYGERNGIEYEIKDDSAEYFYKVWNNSNATEAVTEIMAHEELWEIDLAKLPGFMQAVQEQLQDMINNGVLATVEQLENKKVTA